MVLVHQQEPPWKFVRGFQCANATNLVHLNNTSGGVLSADELQFSLKAGAGSGAQVTTTGATRIYRSRTQANPARCSTSIEVETGATLDYLPDALIPYAGSCYRQDTTVSLQHAATLYWWEIISPGREAFGEKFAYRSLRLETRIHSGTEPIAVERIHIEPEVSDPSSRIRLAALPHWATLYVCKPGEPRQRWVEMERELREITLTLDRPNEVRWGVACLAQHGLIVRGTSRSGRHLSTGLVALWSKAKLLLSGHAAVLPRKLY